MKLVMSTFVSLDPAYVRVEFITRGLACSQQCRVVVGPHPFARFCAE